jgi:hypothetical protein
MLITLSPIILMLVGISVTGPSFRLAVAVPLNILTIKNQYRNMDSN